MKTINHSVLTTFVLSALSLILFSCTNLEPNDADSIFQQQAEDGTVIPDNASELVDASYNNLAVFAEQNNVYSLYQHTSDEMIPPTRGTDWGDNGVWRTLHAHTWDPTHEYVLSAWNDMNRRLFLTQEILAAQPLSDEQRAQAVFLQGFYTWHVLDLFGQVPFRDFNQGVDELPRVISRSEAIDQAIQNVEDAVSALPSGGPGENIRGTKAAAYAILTRMYLNRAVYSASDPAGPYTFADSDLQKVIENADLVTAEGYTIDPNYFEIFETNSTNEPILVSNNGSPENRWFMTLHYDQNPSGWNGFTTISELYDSFDDDDPRLGMAATPDGTPSSSIGTGFLVGQQFDDNGDLIVEQRGQTPLVFTEDVPLAGANVKQGIRVIKYHPARSKDAKYIILRYGEVLMNKAEAQFRLGDVDGALNTINEIRSIRGGSPLATLDEAELLQERSRELYWEGTRRSDQVRFGTFTGSWSEKEDSDPTRVLFPIPQQAIDSNPNLEQNPGY